MLRFVDSRKPHRTALSAMTISAPPPGLQQEDYEEIEAAVMETARGRWFLAEYGRRARAAEGEKLLAALERLESRLEAQGALAPEETFSVAERLAELAWTLRECGVEDFVCGKIDALAREFSGGVKVAPRRTVDTRPAGHVDEHEREDARRDAPRPAGAMEKPLAAEEKPETAPVLAREAPASVRPEAETPQSAEPPVNEKEPEQDFGLTATETDDRSTERQPETAPVEAAFAAASLEPVLEPPTPVDPRLAALSWLDRLPLVDRMALFA